MKMYNDYVYGVTVVPSSKFDELDSQYFISGTTSNVVYMCANDRETEYLSSLGIEVVSCDYYKIVRGIPDEITHEWAISVKEVLKNVYGFDMEEELVKIFVSELDKVRNENIK